MFSFPQESISKAKEITEEYNSRYSTKLKKARALYDAKFIETAYGFSDSIKSGKCARFLHEVKRDIECFSLAGVNYLVAKELGLNPTIYWATDLKDVGQGEDPDDAHATDHAFVTVKINGKELLLDPNYGAMGFIKKTSGEWIVKDLNNRYKETIRTYSMISEMSEQDYLERIHRYRTPEFGKEVLSAAQKVKSRSRIVMIEYSPTNNKFYSFVEFPINTQNKYDSPIGRCSVIELEREIDDSGNLLDDNSIINTYIGEVSGWRRDQYGEKSMRVSMSIEIVNQYIKHLETAVKYHGRSTSIRRIVSNDLYYYFFKRGFDFSGRVHCENGVDKKEHARLIDRIIECSDIGNEMPEVQTNINFNAEYNWRRQNNISESNPQGLLYSEEEYAKLEKEMLQNIEDDIMHKFDVYMTNIKADAGFEGGLIQKAKKLEIVLGKKGHVDFIKGLLEDRRENSLGYKRKLDSMLFYKEHEGTSFNPTQDALINYSLYETHANMIQLALKLPSLMLPEYRKGLKQILAM